MQHSQPKISKPLNTTQIATEKNTPRSQHSLINPPQKVRTPVRKIQLLVTKDATRYDLDQAAKKPTIEQGRGLSPLTKRPQGRGNSPLTKRQGSRENSPLATIEKGRWYRPQKYKGNLGENKLKIYPLRSKFSSKKESWKK